MVFSLDFLGFGSKRKWAFRELERTWLDFGADIRAIDGGVKQLFWQWARQYSHTDNEFDQTLHDLAVFSTYIMLGHHDGEDALGVARATNLATRLAAVLNGSPERPYDEDTIKLLIHCGLAHESIAAEIEVS